VIRSLNSELDAEQAQKFRLEDELQQECDKTKKLTKQITDVEYQMKELREEMCNNNSESNQNVKFGNSSQEALLKQEIKSLETCISSLQNEIDVLQQGKKLLQGRVLKAEHNYQMLFAESRQNETLCEKLQHDAAEKECALVHMREMYSELQTDI